MKRLSILLAAIALAGGVRAAKPGVASTNAPPEFAPQVRESTYAPAKKRDPFQRGGQRVTKTPNAQTSVTPQPIPQKPQIPASLFRLQAIILDQRGLLAVVNGEQLELNKPVTMLVGTSEMKVKAVQIARDRVVLEVEEQKVEVRLEEPGAPPKPK
jgi:Tfp pilus assembly protein PilP